MIIDAVEEGDRKILRTWRGQDVLVHFGWRDFTTQRQHRYRRLSRRYRSQTRRKLPRSASNASSIIVFYLGQRGRDYKKSLHLCPILLLVKIVSISKVSYADEAILLR